MTLSDMVQLIFPANGNPILCRKHRWFEEQPWAIARQERAGHFQAAFACDAAVVVQGGETYSLGDGTWKSARTEDRTYEKGDPEQPSHRTGRTAGRSDGQ